MSCKVLGMNLKVTKSNELLTGAYRLTLLEIRIILFGISKVNPMRPMPASHSIKCLDMANFYNIEESELWQQLKETMKNRLFERKLVVKDERRTLISRWITDMEIDHEKREISYIYNSRLVPHLTQIEKTFTTYGLDYIAKMKSIYGIRFYEWSIMTLRAAGKSAVSYRRTVDELKHDLELEDKYKQLADFRKYVLDMAVREICAHSDIIFDYHIERRGRTIEYIEFHARFNATKKLVDSAKTRPESTAPEPEKKQNASTYNMQAFKSSSQKERDEEEKNSRFRELKTEEDIRDCQSEYVVRNNILQITNQIDFKKDYLHMPPVKDEYERLNTLLEALKQRLKQIESP